MVKFTFNIDVEEHVFNLIKDNPDYSVTAPLKKINFPGSLKDMIDKEEPFILQEHNSLGFTGREMLMRVDTIEETETEVKVVLKHLTENPKIEIKEITL